MQKNLVIVESPAKAKTIEKFLGKDFKVLSSYGHIRDLKKKEFSIDVDKDFKPHYETPADKKKIVTQLKEEAEQAETVWLASDEDREGEAIAWHLYEVLKLKPEHTRRIVFHEITKGAILKAIENPRDIDINLVDAQQARRILDRIVGFELSPVLWKKVKPALSAGRVQSVAVRLIVEREREIHAFQTEASYRVTAVFLVPDTDGKTVEMKAELAHRLKTKAEARKLLESCKAATFTISDITTRPLKKTPAAPFTTSTLLQEAARKLGFPVSMTMRGAQTLYESGLITYMRTDSMNLSDLCLNSCGPVIEQLMVAEYHKRRTYNTHSKGAQEAHEAIRPTDMARQHVEGTPQEKRLYELIWKRTIASQMADALLDTVSVDIEADNCMFKATGSTVKFDGFTVLYDDAKGDKSENKNLPELENGMEIKVKSLEGNQHFTQAPPRYTEATLIKALEENGIGRPSTYAPTITTITTHLYVEREGKQLKPTVLGEVTTELMKEHFPNILDVKFTADMENSLDDVERGKKSWVDTLEDFYGDFSKTLETAEEKMEGKRVKVPDEETDIVCDQCGRNMVIKIGRYGRFLACPGFPECKNTKKIVQETAGSCPLCGNKIILKKSKRGRSFYGCNAYPDCNFMTWNVPTEEKCPQCGCTLFQKGGKSGTLVCEKPGCGYSRPVGGGA